MHKKVVLAVVMLLVLSLGFGTLMQAKDDAPKPDAKADKQEKAAVVNGTTIPMGDLEAEMARYTRQMTMTGQTLPPEKASEIRKQVLDGLVSREILRQETAKKGIKVDEAEVDAQIAALKKRFPSEAEFGNTLSRMNLSETELKSQFSNEMAIKKMIEQEVTSKITIAPDQSKSFYEKNPDLFKTPEMVKASHILVSLPEKSSDEEKAKAKAKIEEVQKRLQKGEDFATLAKEVSDCPSKEKGGDLDFFERGQMVGPFEDAAFALKVGETSGIVQTQFGFHIIKVTDRKEPSMTPYEEIKERIEQHLKQEEANEQLVKYIDGLRSKATIETFIQ